MRMGLITAPMLARFLLRLGWRLGLLPMLPMVAGVLPTGTLVTLFILYIHTGVWPNPLILKDFSNLARGMHYI